VNIHVRFGYRALRWAALSGIASLALMVWGVLDPRPIALVIAMSVGQALGTVAFLVFCLLDLTDLRNARVFSRISARTSGAPPPDSQ
jgi:hypothetical protein